MRHLDAHLTEVRRARTLVVTFAEGQLRVQNFLTKQAFTCQEVAIRLLASCQEWQTAATVAAAQFDFETDSVLASISNLICTGGLVVRGTPEADRDEEYSESWEWKEEAAFLHFSIRNTRFFSNAESMELMYGKRSRPSPALFISHEGWTLAYRLRRPSATVPLFRTMLERRSRRAFGPGPITTKQLGDCLFAGLGITAIVDEPVAGRLPLKMTPSGGARNPYEAYILVRAVRGLQPGLYHYSAVDHSLGFLRQTTVTGGQLLAGQEWATSAGAVVILVANFERTMWKYSHPTGYRVVLIEAGHIAQNIILAAEWHSLAVTPTGALADSLIEETLQIRSVTISPIYALAIGVAGGAHNDCRSTDLG